MRRQIGTIGFCKTGGATRWSEIYADPVRLKVIRTDGSDHDDRVGGVAVIRLDGATRKIR